MKLLNLVDGADSDGVGGEGQAVPEGLRVQRTHVLYFLKNDDMKATADKLIRLSSLIRLITRGIQ